MRITSKTINYTVDTVDELLTLNGEENSVVVVTDENRGGTFIYRSAEGGVNNGGTIFDGWCRQYDGVVNVKWFGAKGDSLGIGGNGTDDTASIQSAINASAAIFMPDGIFRTTETLKDNGTTITINGNISKGITGTSSDNSGSIIFVDGNIEGIYLTSPRSSMLNVKVLGDGGAFDSLSSGIHSNNASRGMFENVTVEGCRGHGFLLEKGNVTMISNLVALSNADRKSVV